MKLGDEVVYKSEPSGSSFKVSYIHEDEGKVSIMNNNGFSTKVYIAEIQPVEAEKESKKSALDVQVGSNHYKNLAIQPIEYITKNNLSFSQGNVIKYITRYKNKNGLEDLKKAKHMIDLMIQLEYNDN